MREDGISGTVSADRAGRVTGEPGRANARSDGKRKPGRGQPAPSADIAWEPNTMRLWLKTCMEQYMGHAAEDLTDLEAQIIFAGAFYGFSFSEAAEFAGATPLQAAAACTYARRKMRAGLGAEGRMPDLAGK